MFLPLVMRPLSAGLTVGNAGAPWITEAPVSIVRGPPGSYLAEALAASIRGWGRWQDCVWLRPMDTQPRSRWRSHSPASACTAGPPRASATRTTPRHRPRRRGPTGRHSARWPPGRRRRTRARMPPRLRRGPAPRCPATCSHRTRTSLVAVTETRCPPAPWAPGRRVLPAADIVADRATSAGEALDRRRRDRLAWLAGRRAAVVHDIVDAVDAWGSEAVVDALDAIAQHPQLARPGDGRLLNRSDPGQRAALAACLSTGYWHPSLETVDVPLSTSGPGWSRWRIGGDGSGRSGRPRSGDNWWVSRPSLLALCRRPSAGRRFRHVRRPRRARPSSTSACSVRWRSGSTA